MATVTINNATFFGTPEECAAFVRAMNVPPVKTERPLKVGDRVTYLGAGPCFGDSGIVTSVYDYGFDVEWSEDEYDKRKWSDIGIYVAKTGAPARTEPANPAGPAPGMRVVMEVDDVTYEGVIYDCQPTRFWVEWSNGAGDYRPNSDFGTVVKPAPAAEVKPVSGSGTVEADMPKVDMHVTKRTHLSSGFVTRVGDGSFAVSWADGEFKSYPMRSFGVHVVPWRQP